MVGAAGDAGDAGSVEVLIREYGPDDTPAIRRCVVELQEFERAIDPRLRPGDAMADAYWAQIQARCAEANGRVFVAAQDGAVVGFVAVLAAQPFTDLDDPAGTYALVTDVVVQPAHRGRGIGSQLLRHAESFVRAAGATELRIGVLAGNTAARRLYVGRGFRPHLEVLVKRW
jgi:ribosomal protein S18 acetylase RimI-like enzyme